MKRKEITNWANCVIWQYSPDHSSNVLRIISHEQAVEMEIPDKKIKYKGTCRIDCKRWIKEHYGFDYDEQKTCKQV